MKSSFMKLNHVSTFSGKGQTNHSNKLVLTETSEQLSIPYLSFRPLVSGIKIPSFSSRNTMFTSFKSAINL